MTTGRAGTVADEAGSAGLDRVTRTMALALGVGAALFVFLALEGFLAQYPVVQPWWSWGAAIGIFGPLIVAGALSRAASPRVLRRLAATVAVLHLAALLLYLPALAHGALASDVGAPWILHVSVLGTAAAAVAWRPAITWPYVAICVVVLGLDRWLASAYPIPDLAIQDALHTALFDTIFTALALATRRAGRALDDAAASAVREVRVASAADSRRRERGRVEALVHDTVLVALLAAAGGSVRAPTEAREALDRLAGLDEPAADTVDPQQWIWQVQALTTDLAPDARFSYELQADRTLPAEAATAALQATAEALRNSAAHAGPAARAVHARAFRDGFEVTVLDNGRGFAQTAIPSARLGVAIGILDRMRSVPGGGAVVVSRPGVGTRVAISWDGR